MKNKCLLFFLFSFFSFFFFFFLYPLIFFPSALDFLPPALYFLPHQFYLAFFSPPCRGGENGTIYTPVLVVVGFSRIPGQLTGYWNEHPGSGERLARFRNKPDFGNRITGYPCRYTDHGRHCGKNEMKMNGLIRLKFLSENH